MRIIWATRGRTWGFRFLLDAAYPDPLPAYERAFSGLEEEPSLCVRVGTQVALRFPDPEARRDAAGRVIPHDFVIPEPLGDEEPWSDKVNSVDAGLDLVWPLVRDVFARFWDAPKPPDAATIRTAIQRSSGQPPADSGD